MELIEIKSKHEVNKHSINNNSRIVVVGVSGSGKSTLAKQLSEKYDLVNIELDSLFLKPNWVQCEKTEFRKMIKEKIEATTCYVIDGNYNSVSDITWGNSDIIIWLDFSLPVIMCRLLKRTIIRIITKEKLWNGNVETFRKSFMAKDSIILWALKTHKKIRKMYNILSINNDYNIKEFIIIKKPSLTYKIL